MQQEPEVSARLHDEVMKKQADFVKTLTKMESLVTDPAALFFRSRVFEGLMETQPIINVNYDKRLGSGTHGAMHPATMRANKHAAEVKCVAKVCCSSNFAACFVAQIQAWRSRGCRHGSNLVVHMSCHLQLAAHARLQPVHAA